MASVGLEEGPSRRRRPSTATIPSLRVRQTILKGPSQLLRVLGFPHSSREVAIARWVESDLELDGGEDRAIAVRWICEKREQIITAALEELIECRQQTLQRDAAAEAVVKRLNDVYNECSHRAAVAADVPTPTTQ